MTDPIADLLTRIRNALMARHPSVLAPSSTLKVAIAQILRDEGFIRGFEVSRGNGPKRSLRLHLLYDEQHQPIITSLQRVSKPGLRIYVGQTEIPRHYGGLGISILSTSKGVMTGKRAWRERIGGEILCHVR